MKARKEPDLEMEANIFAVCLLIPGDMLRAELTRRPLDLGDDTRFKELCKLFDVTAEMMVLRMSLMKLY